MRFARELSRVPAHSVQDRQMRFAREASLVRRRSVAVVSEVGSLVALPVQQASAAPARAVAFASVAAAALASAAVVSAWVVAAGNTGYR
jgi:hypothetical protein